LKHVTTSNRAIVNMDVNERDMSFRARQLGDEGAGTFSIHRPDRSASVTRFFIGDGPMLERLKRSYPEIAFRAASRRKSFPGLSARLGRWLWPRAIPSPTALSPAKRSGAASPSSPRSRRSSRRKSLLEAPPKPGSGRSNNEVIIMSDLLRAQYLRQNSTASGGLRLQQWSTLGALRGVNGVARLYPPRRGWLAKIELLG
jgi:hypothetical protein